MRSIWKGSISFGLVTIPVKLYSATEEKDISFRQVHREDGGRIRYKRECTIDGEEVPYADIAKGYEMPDGSMVVLTDDDLASVPLTTSRAIDVVQFVPLEQIDPIYFNRSYYLEPDKAGVKPYVLLARALEESGQVAVVKVALRQRESLAALRVRDGVFVLETMLWPDEVREVDFGFLDDDVDVRPQELAMAGTLIDSLSGEFDPTAFTDAYREALEELIEAKVEGQEVVQPVSAAPVAGAVVDLMAALRASVDAAKARGAGASGTPSSTAKKPARTEKTGSTAVKPTKGTKAAKPAAKKAVAKKPAKPAKPRAAVRKSA
ncbi:MAG TPA: Ku protein [Mycobacteriales bacterium]|nr:Ku protein [Mycobacteriales bacterium]